MIATAMVDVVVMEKEQDAHCKRIDASDELEMTANMQLVDVCCSGCRAPVCRVRRTAQSSSPRSSGCATNGCEVYIRELAEQGGIVLLENLAVALR